MSKPKGGDQAQADIEKERKAAEAEEARLEGLESRRKEQRARRGVGSSFLMRAERPGLKQVLGV